MTDEKDKNELNPTEENPWYTFMEKTLELDEANEKDRGYHWFWGLYYLRHELPKFPKFDIKTIQDKLPDEHWLKKESELPPHYSNDFKALVNDFIGACIDRNNNSKILFMNPNDISYIFFAGRNFTNSINFSNFIFPVVIQIIESELLGISDFSNTIFLDNVSFNKTTFFKNVNFKNAAFYGNTARFIDVNFKNTADFTDTNFEGFANFKKAEFNGNTSFKNAKVHNHAYFEDAKFLSNAVFNNIAFSKDVRFTGAEFSETADFEEAIFYGKTAKFKGVVFNKIANFTDAKFGHYANFKNATFSGRTSFQRAEFELHAPRFYESSFNDEMTFSGMIPPKFGITEDDKKDKNNQPLNDEKAKEKYKKRVGENQNSFENTSTKLGNQKKYHDEHLFFRQEMRCRRRLGNTFSYLIYWLYEHLADYGYGVGRAFRAWSLHMCFWAMILMFINYQKNSMVENPFWCSILTSVVNAHNFFLAKGGGLKSCYDEKTSSLALSFVWGIETIFGIALLFLLLLTLRIRFRLK